ncbi:MAG TPA: TetR/AcrR family transcriptional regulator [Solirubrobacteraceae bacterium]|jgi:AcrR family transcriptional regulator|nr:TetR/AcrR family transcriptional regulator [Solirubrobacteraceae bacterium]
MSTHSQRAPRLGLAERREQLLEAALAVVGERGFDAVTIDSVARRAGVTRPVVYDSFGDLEQLLLALIEREEHRALGPLLDVLDRERGVDTDPAEFLATAVATFLEAVRANPRTWRLLLMPARGTSEELRRRIQSSRRMLAERILPLLEWGIAQRGGWSGFDLELGARLIVAAGEDAARLTLAHPRRFAPERFAVFAAEGGARLPEQLRVRGTPPPRPIELHGPVPVRVEELPESGRLPRAKRGAQLLDVTLVLLGEEGFGALSMEAIARRAGVNRAVVYRSFPNLGVLLATLLRREDRRTRRVLAGLLPAQPRGQQPVRVLGEALSRFLEAVVSQPETWRLALLRPETAPVALQKLVEHRRRQLARRLEPLVEWGLSAASGSRRVLDVEILSRMLLSVAEEEGRLALEDPEFPPQRLLASSWALLDALWSA